MGKTWETITGAEEGCGLTWTPREQLPAPLTLKDSRDWPLGTPEGWGQRGEGMEKQGKEERSGSEMPSQGLHEQGCHGGHTYTHPTLPSTLCHPTHSGQSGQSPWSWEDPQNIPEWGWMYNLLLSLCPNRSPPLLEYTPLLPGNSAIAELLLSLRKRFPYLKLKSTSLVAFLFVC